MAMGFTYKDAMLVEISVVYQMADQQSAVHKKEI